MTEPTPAGWYAAIVIAQAAVTRFDAAVDAVGAALTEHLAAGADGSFAEVLLAAGIVDAETRDGLHEAARQLADTAKTVLDATTPDAAVVSGRPSVLFALRAQPFEAEATVPDWTPHGGTQADKYRTVRLLGRGGMGEVYEVRDLDLLRNVALKRISNPASRSDLLSRFLQEAQITAQLEHPNIIPAYDLGVLRDGTPFFTMRRVAGKTLATVFDELAAGNREVRAHYSDTRLAIVFLKVVQAVGYAHARGVMHCDLKPGNLMVGEHGEALVTDWGLARRWQPEGKTLATPVEVSLDEIAGSSKAGTVPFMAPEQLRGENLDPRADIYALGVILYELLTLRRPFEAEESDALLEAQRRGPTPPGELASDVAVPEELEAICLRAMAFAPEDRFNNADELADAVEASITGARRRQQAEQRHAAGEAARMRLQASWQRAADIEVQINTLSAQIKPYDGETKKTPLWKMEEELFTTRLECEEALAEAIDCYGQAVSLAPDLAAPQERLADLHLKLFLEAEALGDRRGQIFHRRQVERFHRGRHAVTLEGRGLLSLKLNDADVHLRGQTLVERGKKIVPDAELELGAGSIDNLSLPMGSYLFSLHKDGHKSITLPVHVGRGENLALETRLYAEETVGEGFVHIPAGPFIYGGDPVALNAGPRRSLWLNDFFISTYPVTCAQYLDFLNALAARDAHQASLRVPRTKPDGGYLWEADGDGTYRLPRHDADGNPTHADAPVMGVSFVDAQAYSDWASERDGTCYRLPTEQEWEKAARGADGRFFPWGNGFDPTFCKMALSRPGRPQPEPVGAFPTDTSVYGMRDCAGGIREWCDDFYDDAKETRVLRGGAWYFNPTYCRLAFRHGYLPHIVFTNFGFRLCKSPPAGT